VSHEEVEGFETIGPAARIHKALRLDHIGVSHHQFQNVYNKVAYRYWLTTPPTLVGANS
jgi:predicted Ser/Thr protein kinase